MKRSFIRHHNRPILASDGSRIGWPIPAALVFTTLLLVLMFLATPDRTAYTPFFATPVVSGGVR